MRVIQGSIDVQTKSAFDIVDITSLVEKWISEKGVSTGILVAYVPHTTASIVINEAEPGLLKDIVDLLKEETKPGANWRHNLVDSNAHAHLTNVLLGSDKVIPVSEGKLSLGTWQRVLLVEMDGPRKRKVVLVYIGE